MPPNTINMSAYEGIGSTSQQMSGVNATTTFPGNGWTNGAVPQSMFPTTREGRVTLYSTHRRWIHSHSSWSRIGTGSEMDAKHSDSASGISLTQCLKEEGRIMRALIVQLCEFFYKLGWATGTGGGVSIRTGEGTPARPFRVFVAPSGLQKEDMIGDDVFELDMERQIVNPPKTPNLRQSACTPLWYVVYKHRPSARCVIHTHSMNAVMATLLKPHADTLELTHLEMLKGVGNHAYDDSLVIPIIDNRPTEDLLASQLEKAVLKYPKCNAVLVRRHGLYCWGDSWEQAKTQCESFDYLFETAIKMKSLLGLDSAEKPTNESYRVHVGPPPAKRAKKSTSFGSSNTGFNGVGAVDNADDLLSKVPLLPRDSKTLLLDIEGCTTAISFVHDKLFPYVLSHLESYLETLTLEELASVLQLLNADFAALQETHPAKLECSLQDQSTKIAIQRMVKAMMKFDVKATGLKNLQGKMWKSGYASGELKGHVYSDFVPLLNWCEAQGVSVNIYSSGSIGAQKLLFGNLESGDVLSKLSQHFDTTSGNKKEARSYTTIAAALQHADDPSQIVFVSDSEDELVAARSAGLCAVMSIRPGNAPLTRPGEFPTIYTLMQLCGSHDL